MEKITLTQIIDVFEAATDEEKERLAIWLHNFTIDKSLPNSPGKTTESETVYH